MISGLPAKQRKTHEKILSISMVKIHPEAPESNSLNLKIKIKIKN